MRRESNILKLTQALNQMLKKADKWFRQSLKLKYMLKKLSGNMEDIIKIKTEPEGENYNV